MTTGIPEGTRNPRTDPIAWDNAAEAAGIKIGEPGSYLDGETKLGFPRPFGPHREPSRYCESGKRPYCTCDSCF